MKQTLTTTERQNTAQEVRIEPLGNKRDVATMLKMSTRSVDNYLAMGCPVIKLSPRRCRFDLAEVKQWFKNKYGEQRRGRPEQEGESDNQEN